MEYRYNGEYDSKKKNNMQETIEFVLNMKYGQMLYDDELAKILGYNIDDEEEKHKYKSIMGRIKNFVLQYGYVLKGVGGIGYYILKPKEISKHCYKTYIKSAARMYDKSAYVLDRTARIDLSEERLEELQNIIELNKKLIENSWNVLQESAYYSRKDYYDSLVD